MLPMSMPREMQEHFKKETDLLIERVNALYIEYDAVVKDMLEHEQDESTIFRLEELYTTLNAKISNLENKYKMLIIKILSNQINIFK
jgi:predicted nuclease with TOPRIM domain